MVTLILIYLLGLYSLYLSGNFNLFSTDLLVSSKVTRISGPQKLTKFTLTQVVKIVSLK